MLQAPPAAAERASRSKPCLQEEYRQKRAAQAAFLIIEACRKTARATGRRKPSAGVRLQRTLFCVQPAAWMFEACLPFGPWVTSNWTF